MNLTNIFALLSTVLAAYTVVPYIQAILKRKTKPHQFTWIVFVIMNAIVFLSQYLEGARASVLISLTFFICSLLILLFSFKYGVRNSSKFDSVLFIFALFLIVIWFITKNNELAIWLTVLIDIIATSIMILKIKKDPYSEDPKPWLIAAVAYIFTCLTLVGQPLSILYVRPMYGLLVDSSLVIFIYAMKRKSESKRRKLV